MKEFHIISSGVSILSNAQRFGVLPPDLRISNEEYWKNILDEPRELNKIKNFLSQDPQKYSAELNTFLRVVQNKNPEDIEVYLFGTRTYSNEICRRVIEDFLKNKGYKIYIPIEISGYFWEAQYYNETFARDQFKQGISELLDRLIYIAKKKKEEGYKVYLNPTGGLKAHVIAAALAGFLIGVDVYYMNEEFNEVVFLPRLLYLPRGKELEILERLHETTIISGMEASKLYSNYKNEVERLLIYGLITSEVNEFGEIYRIRITHKGELIYAEISENVANS